MTEHGRGAGRRVWPPPSDTVLVLLRAVRNPQETADAQGKAQHSPGGDGGEKLRGKALIMGRGRRRIELPERALGQGCAPHPPPSGQDEAGLSLQGLGRCPHRCPSRPLDQGTARTPRAPLRPALPVGELRRRLGLPPGPDFRKTLGQRTGREGSEPLGERWGAHRPRRHPQ